MDLVGDADLIAESSQAVAVWAVADHQQMDVVADHLQQVGGPDGVFHPFLRPESPDQADQPAAFGQFQFGQQLPPRGGGRIGQRHAVGNHLQLLGGRAVPHVEIANAFAVDHHAAATPGQDAIDGQLRSALPGIDAPLAATMFLTPQALAAA